MIMKKLNHFSVLIYCLEIISIFQKLKNGHDYNGKKSVKMLQYKPINWLMISSVTIH